MIDWLFTPQCAACAIAATPPFCDACAPSLVESDDRDVIIPIRTIAPWRFGGALASAIRRLKFAGKLHVARDLAPLWSPVLAAIVREHPEALVVPVPLHWRRRMTRGFDQAWLLARRACEHAAIAPPTNAMSRIRYTPPQSKLTAAARRTNLATAFLARAEIVRDRTIILTDDVVTTGATFAAASTALARAGAKTVIGLAIARTF